LILPRLIEIPTDFPVNSRWCPAERSGQQSAFSKSKEREKLGKYFYINYLIDFIEIYPGDSGISRLISR
jgi:hypothetical protein